MTFYDIISVVMNHNDLFNLLRTVHRNVRCPQCGKQYSFSDINIRGIVDSVCFLELQCTDHMPLVATVMMEHKKEPKAERPIQSDDVIEAHRLLKDFKGNFKEIFEKK